MHIHVHATYVPVSSQVAERRKRRRDGFVGQPYGSGGLNYVLMLCNRVPPAVPPKHRARPPRIDLPEDRLIRAYYRKYPMARTVPIDLNSFEPPIARKFAWRQMELMKDGMSQDEAFAKVEAEMGLQLEALSAQRGVKSVLGIVQYEEERILVEAMKAQKLRPVQPAG
ncbi:unnamed protein product [Ostreobium quekettii]|uniref:Small ribosomal subunit protein mS23 n=1 Tax=Ostreobium quekettii TaxID=121088 RepID=A0A8S1J3X2_9CHLO|nr:unnamed protein product [Ostreobium quekettii]